jgi:outer membrane protein OmpA-like peptidoglycan-associated protein
MFFRSLKNKDNRSILMVRGFIFLVFCFFSVVSPTDVLGFDNIKLRVVLVNGFDGNQIKSNFEVKVTLDPGNQEIKPTYDKKESSYSVPEGKSIKVVANAVGFYTEQKLIETASLGDGDVVEIQMNPKPSGKLELTTVDSETKDPVESEVEIVFFSRNNREKINEENPRILYFYEMKGTYKVTIQAKGYLKDYRELELDISADQKTAAVVVELVKNRMKQEVNIFDVSTNAKINSGTASVTHVETGQKIFDGKIENGVVRFDGNRNDNYTIQTKVSGFSDFKSPFKLDGKPQKFGITPSSALKIDVFDEESGDRLGLDLEITSPSGVKTKAITNNKESYSFVPTEIGSYSIESRAVGYINRSGTFNIKSLAAGNTFFTLRLKKGSNEYLLSVFDSETQKPINAVTIKVFSEQSREVQGKANKNQKTVNLDTEKRYFYEVTAAGYYEHTANITNEKTVKVFLKKKLADSLTAIEIVVVDEQTMLPIKDARLRIFEDNTKALALSFDPVNSVFSSNKVNPKLNYLYELSAKGYNNLRQPLSLAEKKVTIAMTAFEISNFYFSAQDAFTKQNLVANFRIKVGSVEIKQEQEKGKVKVSLSGTNNYNLEVEKEGYKSISKVLDKREADKEEFKISIYRNYYPILFKINQSVDAATLSEVKASIKNKVDNKSEALVFNESKSGFEGRISAEGSYFLDIEMPDFEKYTGAFMLKQANPESLEYVITLRPKKKPVENVKPEKEQVKTETLAPKAKSPKLLEMKTEAVVSGPAMDIQKGVKYPLEGVVFEKSKTTLVKGAEQKLEGLLQYLKQNPKAQIEIAGHTDNEGNDQRLNQRLSEFRAKVVANYLFNKGIAPERILTIGKGSLEPIVTNDTDENRAKNRRIEIKILED